MSSIDPTLQNHAKSEFDQHTFPGIDARMVFLPIGSRPQGRLKEALDHAGQQRAYPVEGGHIIKVPSFHVEEFADLFDVERNGWDHEHCDFCNASINVGQQCWTTRDEYFKVACEICYENLGAKAAEPSGGGNSAALRASP
jgi:hypothetical protein